MHFLRLHLGMIALLAAPLPVFAGEDKPRLEYAKSYERTYLRIEDDGTVVPFPPDAPQRNAEPYMFGHPASVAVKVGEPAVFGTDVCAPTGQPPRYQWRKNGVAIPGATHATYATPPATIADNGTAYTCDLLMPNGDLANLPYPAWQTVYEEGEKLLDWTKVAQRTGKEKQVPWSPRDSSGELVFKDRMWLLGGWPDRSDIPSLRDVWNSSDGRHWTLVTAEAPWFHGDLPMTLAFKNRMWIMGGWDKGRMEGATASSQVWSSEDGVKWTQATANAWPARWGSTVVEFKGKMFILGGSKDFFRAEKEESYLNDVWCSDDGQKWTQVTAAAEWSPRKIHQALVMNDRIFIIGGANFKNGRLNDVWYSADGVRWVLATSAAPWRPRQWFSTVVYRDRMWVLGGNTQHGDINDVWYSRDGKAWKQLKSKAAFKRCHEHSAWVFKDKIFIGGGCAEPGATQNPEVWSLQVPMDWFRD